ncbi:hypothetical protein ACQZ6V_23710 [Agrobacterium sp. 22-3674b3]
MTQHYLGTSLRRALEKTIKEARIVAEAGASGAIRRLGIAEAKAPTYLSDDEKELRRRLRAHARTLGDSLDKDSDEQEVKRLEEAAAYAHWHRMLFARFLAERGLLRHPEHNVPVTLEDCREIAQEEGAADAWMVAERYAASMLPAVFRIDDPVLSLSLDAAQNQSLHRLVTDLDDDVFQAEDSLGWTYQFWRAAEKDAINKTGDKIGADEISAVTQLFTEPYMVRFLLHNTLGAWWAGKVLASNPELAKNASDEDALRTACSLPGYTFGMLRFVKEGEGDDVRWRPAAGTFPAWPTEAKNVTTLDPCCGSGHFLTEALAILSALRQAEESLTAADAVVAVLWDNLHGLEIDGRCVQIAAFAVALSAWRIGGWQNLPPLQIAWVGSPPPLPKPEFIALAQGDVDLSAGLSALYDLFIQAPILGSLIEPSGGDLGDTWRLGNLAPRIEAILAKAELAAPEYAEGAIAAKGMTAAAKILSARYTLQATNVPFLGRGKQNKALSDHIARFYASAKADLSTAMMLRMLRLAGRNCTVACVSPQNWWQLGSYKKFREVLFDNTAFDLFAGVGANGFQTPMFFFNVGLTIFDVAAVQDAQFSGLEVNDSPNPDSKATSLSSAKVSSYQQIRQKKNPDYGISLDQRTHEVRVGDVASAFQGLSTGDNPQLTRYFWEIANWNCWLFAQGGSKAEANNYSGCETVVNLSEQLRSRLGAVRGRNAWDKSGIAVTVMGSLKSSIYTGSKFFDTVSVIIPKQDQDLLPLYALISDEKFGEIVRGVDRALSVTDSSFEKVPFDREHWEGQAKALFPDGLPEPFSTDPTQWLYHGHPANADKGTAIHIALARFCGYRWPAEADKEMRLSPEARSWSAEAAALPDGDQDGLLSVAGVAGDKPLADRLRAYLEIAFGSDWSDALERRLVSEADEVLDRKQAKDGSLESWLRDRAFRQHCSLFHQRPFLWHIWDGLKDGFSVFVHYHRFTQANLRKLTYTMLGDWLRRAKDENNDLRYEKGRELQQMLEKVLEGEAPYDIFVRWKSLAQQPLGWDPDIDDGVRMNIRPFMEAGILREQPKGIKWTKDRGNDVPSAPWYPVFKGERNNLHHTTIEEKRAARAGNPETVAKK